MLGVSRQVYLVNGQTPGPELVANQGDQLSVTIANQLIVSTTIHVSLKPTAIFATARATHGTPFHVLSP